MNRWSALVDRNNGALIAKVKTNLKDSHLTVVIEDCDFALNTVVSDKDWEEAKNLCRLPTAYLIDGESSIFRISYPSV